MDDDAGSFPILGGVFSPYLVTVVTGAPCDSPGPKGFWECSRGGLVPHTLSVSSWFVLEAFSHCWQYVTFVDRNQIHASIHLRHERKEK